MAAVETKITDMVPGVAITGPEMTEAVQAGGTVSLTETQRKTFVLTCPLTFTEVVGSSALTLTGATQTASHPLLSGTQTWNNAAVTFAGIKSNITDTASAAASLLMDLQVGGVSQFAVGKAGVVTQVGSTIYSAAAAGPTLKSGGNGRVGTFTCNGVTPVTVANTLIAAGDIILIGLNTVGGTVGAIPHVATITAGTGFTVVGTAADTSVYTYCIIKVV